MAQMVKGLPRNYQVQSSNLRITNKKNPKTKNKKRKEG
jgi:hypothetical protein